ncbi:hypothetical protein [Flavobacterium silvaticum]|uniref:Uncharacterized protein n=1 Tax=Flavobacterium silvaticum TaxID=1852020 RepID=A0A972JGJ7_9FLAO|nr:hypothetical protein [Flavobacterium silvaticum]NMH29114.1 hypothetical protein [Flavobacterium silvaticum]
MKKITTLLAVLFFISAFGQEKKEKAWKKDIHADPLLRAYVFYPLATGNNTLAKAHRENPGIGINMSFVSIYNFHIGAGYHYTQYLVTDRALAGNFRHSNYWGLYPFVSYELPVHKYASIWPEAGLGYAKIKQTYSGERVSNQEGAEFRLSLFADYRFSRYFSIYTGANYIYSKMRIAANPEIRDFYGSLSQLQFCLGFQFEGRPNHPKEDWQDNKTDSNIQNP